MANESFRIPRGILQLSRTLFVSRLPGEDSTRRARGIHKTFRVLRRVALSRATNSADVTPRCDCPYTHTVEDDATAFARVLY